VEIARETPTLIRLIQEHPDDIKVAELSIVTISHAVCAVTNVEDNPDTKFLTSLNMPNVLRVVTDTLRKPTAPHYLVNHAAALLAGSTLYCSKECKGCPSMVTFLVAGLRSIDAAFRCLCLGGLIRLHRMEAEHDQRLHDPRKMVACIERGFPPDLSEILMDYGPDRCDTVNILKTSAENQRAMMTVAQDHDIYALALKLAPLIIRTEYSIAEGVFQSENPRTGKFETMDLGLPFTMWTDALPHCAEAIRTRGKPNEIDLADIIEIKYLIIKSRISDAVTLAKKAIKRSPNVAYFYYAITLTADAADGLRSAKKGLKCKNITPFVRFQMLWRATEHAGDMGICRLQESSVGDKKWEEGVAFLTSALEDSKIYVEQAPPDSKHMKNVLYWYILLNLAIRGPEMSEDLQGLRVRLGFPLSFWCTT